MDDHESNREPDALVRLEVTRRTVIETGTTAVLLTALPRAVVAAGPADSNAVYNACGVRIRDYPITLDKLLSGLPAGV